LALHRVARGLADASRLDNAQQVARSISDAYVRGQALQDIAEKLVVSGRIDDAERLADGLGDADGNCDYDGGAAILARVARHWQLPELLKVQSALLEASPKIYSGEGTWHRCIRVDCAWTTLLLPTGGLATVLGHDVVGAPRTKDAEQIARSIADTPEGARALTAIAQTLADDGRTIDGTAWHSKQNGARA
jgi:hypothetical protein